ncbi:MAG: putative Zn finger-like uncharacterized protein [Gammaproteobacteria bacterium]|jgi:predicted Zn finger-like uncharacterized protein
MSRSAQLGEIMETSCRQCGARFRITDEQLKIALGKVRCGECGIMFNALSSLKSFEGDATSSPRLQPELHAPVTPQPTNSELSLHEAMYGERRNSFTQFSPLLWFIGILLLLVLGIAQTIYYQRYELIRNARYQQQIIQLCELVPCAESQFSSTRQIKLLERNVFTHPVKSNALMVTGSFVNEAPFTQKLPKLLVTLFDIQGNLIANRPFAPTEYLQADQNLSSLDSNKPIQFRLEILDPGTEALTYEFEFL